VDAFAKGEIVMNQTELVEIAERFLSAWNSQDVERVVACYTEDLIYRDPNTRGIVEGADAMRRYLRKLFAAWSMHWTFREGYPFAERDGGAILWHATFREAGANETVEADGMDLVLVRSGRIERNDVYFDRSPLLASAMERRTASPAP
jgi:ketosteroid isomerase-like protein